MAVQTPSLAQQRAGAACSHTLKTPAFASHNDIPAHMTCQCRGRQTGQCIQALAAPLLPWMGSLPPPRPRPAALAPAAAPVLPGRRPPPCRVANPGQPAPHPRPKPLPRWAPAAPPAAPPRGWLLAHLWCRPPCRQAARPAQPPPPSPSWRGPASIPPPPSTAAGLVLGSDGAGGSGTGGGAAGLAAGAAQHAGGGAYRSETACPRPRRRRGPAQN